MIYTRDSCYSSSDTSIFSLTSKSNLNPTQSFQLKCPNSSVQVYLFHYIMLNYVQMHELE